MAHSHSHTSSHLPEDNNARRLLYAFGVTAGFMLVEVVGGFLSGSLAFTNAASVVSLSQPKVWRMVGGRRENCTASRAKSRAAVSVNI